MKKQAQTRRSSSRNEAPAPLTGAEVKTRLHAQRQTLKSWAKQHGYSYDTVSDVVRGVNRGTFGIGHRIAVALGMKRG